MRRLATSRGNENQPSKIDHKWLTQRRDDCGASIHGTKSDGLTVKRPTIENRENEDHAVTLQTGFSALCAIILVVAFTVLASRPVNGKRNERPAPKRRRALPSIQERQVQRATIPKMAFTKTMPLLAASLAAAVLASVAMYWFALGMLDLDRKEALASSIAVFSAVTAFVGLVFAGFNFALVAAEQRKSNLYNQRRNAFDIIDRWRSCSNSMTIVFNLVTDRRFQEIGQLVKHLKESEEEKSDAMKFAITEVLNFFESVELAIKTEIADNETLRHYFSRPYKTLMIPLLPMIKLQQKKRGDETVLRMAEDLGMRWGLQGEEKRL